MPGQFISPFEWRREQERRQKEEEAVAKWREVSRNAEEPPSPMPTPDEYAATEAVKELAAPDIPGITPKINRLDNARSFARFASEDLEAKRKGYADLLNSQEARDATIPKTPGFWRGLAGVGLGALAGGVVDHRFANPIEVGANIFTATTDPKFGRRQEEFKQKASAAKAGVEQAEQGYQESRQQHLDALAEETHASEMERRKAQNLRDQAWASWNNRRTSGPAMRTPSDHAIKAQLLKDPKNWPQFGINFDPDDPESFQRAKETADVMSKHFEDRAKLQAQGPTTSMQFEAPGGQLAIGVVPKTPGVHNVGPVGAKPIARPEFTGQAVANTARSYESIENLNRDQLQDQYRIAQQDVERALSGLPFAYEKDPSARVLKTRSIIGSPEIPGDRKAAYQQALQAYEDAVTYAGSIQQRIRTMPVPRIPGQPPTPPAQMTSPRPATPKPQATKPPAPPAPTGGGRKVDRATAKQALVERFIKSGVAQAQAEAKAEAILQRSEQAGR